MKKIIVFIICAILCSCDSSKRKEVSTENMEAPTPEQTKSEPKIVDRVTVMAEVFHYLHTIVMISIVTICEPILHYEIVFGQVPK